MTRRALRYGTPDAHGRIQNDDDPVGASGRGESASSRWMTSLAVAGAVLAFIATAILLRPGSSDRAGDSSEPLGIDAESAPTQSAPSPTSSEPVGFQGPPPLEPGTSAPASSEVPCAKVLLIAPRGDGPPTLESAEGRRLVESASAHYSERVDTTQTVDAADTRRAFEQTEQRCSDARFLLLGIGEGAEPARAVLNDISAERGPIPLADLLAVSIAVDPLAHSSGAPRGP